MPGRRGRLVWAAAVACLLVLIVAFSTPMLRAAGHLLVVRDPLETADAIVLLSGGTPFREEGAAALYRAGWAPRITVSRPALPPKAQALVDSGVRALDFQGESLAVLERLGVPRHAILPLSEAVRITEAELRVAHRYATQAGWRRVILVTSAEHTRRVKAVWVREARGGIEGLVQPVETVEFAPDRWWRDRRMAEALLHEYLGLIAVYAGISGWMQ